MEYDCDFFYNEDLADFENLNTTTKSIYELDGIDCLIILKNGENLTDFSEVKDLADIVYISLDLSQKEDLSNYFFYKKFSFSRYGHNQLKNVKAIVALNVKSNVTSLKCMFYDLKSLKTVSGLDSWDTSNISDLSGMFAYCTNLETVNGLESFDVENVKNMQYMFKRCEKIKDIGSIKDWKINEECEFEKMFENCSVFVKMEFYSNWHNQLENSFDDIFTDFSPYIDLNKFKCRNCGQFNVIYDKKSSKLLCRNCGHVILEYDSVCRDCSGSNLEFDYGIMGLVCSDCALINNPK